jgi:aryl-alcohol dehydrogenase-like predicted oxidoreductase
MRNHPLGRTGLFVSELCLGTMTFGGTDGIWGKIGDLGQADAERLVGQALDAGINFIDTADVYAGGVSETITGQALKNLKVPRESVVVATKVFGETSPGANGRGNSRGHILDGVKASLKRLQLDQNAEAGSRRQSFDFPPVDRDRADAVIDAMRPIAEAKGVSVAQVALAWLLHQPQVTSVIVGAKRPDQLADNIAATRVTLGADELKALGEASALPAEYPGWMFERQGELRRKQLADSGR